MSPPAQSLEGRTVIVTGATSGIGEATARQLVDRGARVVLGGRREPQLVAVARDLGDRASHRVLDVTDAESCRAFVDDSLTRYPSIDGLVNNAGLARGFADVAECDENDWREMLETNVMGLMRMTKLLVPHLAARPCADIVHVGSIAGLDPYEKGAAYCASKAAVEAFADSLRLELLGTGVRELVIEPGMVDTEFSAVRFHGDRERADAVYRGVTPLRAEDVAECIVFAMSLPAHVSIHNLLVMPTAQAAATRVHREAP